MTDAVDERLVVSALVVLVVVTACAGWLVGVDQRVTFAVMPPADADCRYDASNETLTVVIRGGEIDRAQFAGVWITVDDELATLSARGGATDTGAWVIDGDVNDVANYPLRVGATVTVHSVAATDTVRLVAADEQNNQFAILDTTPAKDCPRA